MVGEADKLFCGRASFAKLEPLDQQAVALMPQHIRRLSSSRRVASWNLLVLAFDWPDARLPQNLIVCMPSVPQVVLSAGRGSPQPPDKRCAPKSEVEVELCRQVVSAGRSVGGVFGVASTAKSGQVWHPDARITVGPLR